MVSRSQCTDGQGQHMFGSRTLAYFDAMESLAMLCEDPRSRRSMSVFGFFFKPILDWFTIETTIYWYQSYWYQYWCWSTTAIYRHHYALFDWMSGSSLDKNHTHQVDVTTSIFWVTHHSTRLSISNKHQHIATTKQWPLYLQKTWWPPVNPVMFIDGYITNDHHQPLIIVMIKKYQPPRIITTNHHYEPPLTITDHH